MKNLVIFIITCTLFNTAMIFLNSVHPTWGNYKKLDSSNLKCMPWDSCL